MPRIASPDDGRFVTPVLTPADTARHLGVPRSTLYGWLAERAAGEPLVHHVPPEHRGWPSVPFIAIIEAYVLRSLRDLGLSKQKIRGAAEAVRRDFGTEYGLATKRIATDGIDIFIEYAGDELARAHDGQTPIKEIIADYLTYITWDAQDEFATRLRLRQYPEIALVIIDPKFGWGAPVIESTKVPVQTVVALWRAGEPMQTVADEFELPRDAVEAICRIAA